MMNKYTVTGDVSDVSVVEVKDVEIEVDCQDDNSAVEENCYTKVVSRIQNTISDCYTKNRMNIVRGLKTVLVLLYLAYFSYCMYVSFGDEGSLRLIAGTAIGVLYIVNRLTPRFKNASCRQRLLLLWSESARMVSIRRWIRRALYVLFAVGIAVYIGVDIASSNPENLQSLLGFGCFIILGFLMSTSPASVNWHPVFWGMGVQFIFALVILRTSWGFAVFDWLGHRVEEFLSYGNAGAQFVFGASYRDHRIAFAVMPVMLFFNSAIFLLYHLGVIQVIIKTLGAFLAFCLDTGPIESVVASANIFIGLNEAPLLVRPFLNSVTSSELHAIMTCGFASIGGGVFGTFVLFGVPANHLLSASVMSAPAALAFTKLMCPETKKSAFSKGVKMELGMEKHRNALSAVSSGAVAAVKIIANTLANQIAFVSFLEFADKTLAWFGDRAKIRGMSFELICSYLFYPASYVMGVASDDCFKMGGMLGKKLFSTPLLGYLDLGTLINNRKSLDSYVSQYNATYMWEAGNIFLPATNQTLIGGIMEERSEVIGTYALCGFCTVTAVGVTLGTLVPMAPERKPDIVRLVVRALIAGTLASFLTGATAGALALVPPDLVAHIRRLPGSATGSTVVLIVCTMQKAAELGLLFNGVRLQ